MCIRAVNLDFDLQPSTSTPQQHIHPISLKSRAARWLAVCHVAAALATQLEAAADYLHRGAGRPSRTQEPGDQAERIFPEGRF